MITGASAPYRAVVTFFNEWTVHTNVYECVTDTCAGLWDDLSDDKLAERLLTHRDLRFRLGYVVGSWRQTPRSAAKANSDWDYEPDAPQAAAATDEFDGVLPAAADIERMQDVLKSWLTRIRNFQIGARHRTADALQIGGDLAADVAAIEVVEPGLREMLERVGEFALLEPRAGLRRFAVDEEGLHEARRASSSSGSFSAVSRAWLRVTV